MMIFQTCNRLLFFTVGLSLRISLVSNFPPLLFVNDMMSPIDSNLHILDQTLYAEIVDNFDLRVEVSLNSLAMRTVDNLLTKQMYSIFKFLLLRLFFLFHFLLEGGAVSGCFYG